MNKKLFSSLKNIGLITQLSITMLTPCLITILFTSWLKNRFMLGEWVVILGIIIGLISGFVSVSKFTQAAMKDAKKSQKEYEDKYK